MSPELIKSLKITKLVGPAELEPDVRNGHRIPAKFYDFEIGILDLELPCEFRGQYPQNSISVFDRLSKYGLFLILAFSLRGRFYGCLIIVPQERVTSQCHPVSPGHV